MCLFIGTVYKEGRATAYKAKGIVCSLQAEFNQKPDSLFFNDGQRRIDFILVYEDENKKENRKMSLNKKQKV